MLPDRFALLAYDDPNAAPAGPSARLPLSPLWLLFAGPIAVFSVWALADNARLYVTTLLNSLTLASLYFLVASGFTLVFGLMRNVNLAHGSLYLFGAYVGWMVGETIDESPGNLPSPRAGARVGRSCAERHDRDGPPRLHS